jgi:hypothetical protein
MILSDSLRRIDHLNYGLVSLNSGHCVSVRVDG